MANPKIVVEQRMISLTCQRSKSISMKLLFLQIFDFSFYGEAFHSLFSFLRIEHNELPD